MPSPSFLKLPSGERLAYHKTEGGAPGLVFLGGFRSDMTGAKALALEEFCRQRGNACVRFDYRGHGASSGDFARCRISGWKEDALVILNRLTKGPQVLVGSSMGGWLALLIAREKRKRIAGVIGIAAAPDFTDRLEGRLTPDQAAILAREGSVMVPSDMGEPYPISRAFIDEGSRHLLLGGEIDVRCPVRLLHGLKDDVVPWEMSLSINEKLATRDVKTILIENGDHRLSGPADIEKLLSVTGKLLEQVQ